MARTHRIVLNLTSSDRLDGEAVRQVVESSVLQYKLIGLASVSLASSSGQNTCEVIAKAALGIDWRDTESQARRVAEHAANLIDRPPLTVWYGPMPESNGRSNFTAILRRVTPDGLLGDIANGITIDRSEYPERVRYEADRMRYLIGEIEEEPFILDYDADKHSGYVPPNRFEEMAVSKNFDISKNETGQYNCTLTIALLEGWNACWAWRK